MGEWSRAQKTQIQIHEAIGSTIPLGWDNQIDNTVGVNIIYKISKRVDFLEYFDIFPETGLTIGNIYTGGSIGILSRVGYNLPDRNGIKSIEPSISYLKKDFSAFLFAKSSLRLVAYNASLQGNLISDNSPHTVDIERLVNENEIGFSVLKGDWSFTLSAIQRSKEFVDQQSDSKFGSVYITIPF